MFLTKRRLDLVCTLSLCARGSSLQCVLLCLEMPACVSVFYRQVSRRCQFHDVVFMSPEDGEDEQGTKYYSLTTGSCPIGYINVRLFELCFRHPLKKIPHDNAVADCASSGEHLIVIDSHEKWEHVRKQIRSSSVSMLYEYYIDGSDEVTEGQWVYHDGRPMEYFSWNDGYPANATTVRDYLLARKALGDLKWWVDVSKAASKYYLCELDV